MARKYFYLILAILWLVPIGLASFPTHKLHTAGGGFTAAVLLVIGLWMWVKAARVWREQQK